jgi:hypothetical protein
MRARDLDALLCDYLDGALGAEERRAFEDLVAERPELAEALADADFARAAIAQAAPAEPPPQLIAEIVHRTIGVGVGGAAPEQFAVEGGFWGFLGAALHPFRQPRFVMGMAMTVLSFSIFTFQAREAFEAWRSPAPAPSPVAALAATFADDAVQVWRRGQELAGAVAEFYRMQTAGSEAPPAASDEPGGE